MNNTSIQIELSNPHANNCYNIFVEREHVFRSVINQAVLFIIIPMPPYFKNTRTRSGNVSTIPVRNEASIEVTDHCDV